MDQKLIDKDGQWVVNTGAYNFADPTTGNIYESNTAYKVAVTDWMRGQPIFKGYDPETGEITALEAPAAPAAPVVAAPVVAPVVVKA